jgi:hypothetical protein
MMQIKILMANEIEGDADCIIYHVHLFGGPNDGEISNCFRPYFYLCINDNVYETDSESDYIQWESDGSRRIDLFYNGAKND